MKVLPNTKDSSSGRIVWVPPVDVRPVALTDVAMLLAHAAVSRPGTGGHEIAGPEKTGLDTFVRAVLAANASTAVCPRTSPAPSTARAPGPRSCVPT